VDSDTLLKLCEPDFSVQHVGRESFAVRDACELAQLNDRRPAVAVGIHDGTWYLVTGGSTELSETANTARSRLSLARQLSRHLSRQLHGTQQADHMQQTDLVEQQVIPELNAVGCPSGIGVSRNGLKILVPSTTVSELVELSSMAASSDVSAGADLPPVCLLPFPPSGWVYYSFGRSNVT
jgi:hypothetical protein